MNEEDLKELIEFVKGGYSFRLTPDKIREFKDLSPEEKLDWLEEANNFIVDAVSPQKLETWERFKTGDAKASDS